MGPLDWWAEGDWVTRSTALMLLGMSVLSWTAMLWKGWMLWQARADLPRSLGLFWQAADLDDALARLETVDRQRLLRPMVEPLAARAQAVSGATLEGRATLALRRTQVLRDALGQAHRRLHAAQAPLATIATAAPFVGLLGTVWGIHHALIALTGGGVVTLDRLAAPVGEALVMTALGLAVAIPAVVGYHLQGRAIDDIEAELEGFAHDLDAWLSDSTPQGMA